MSGSPSIAGWLLRDLALFAVVAVVLLLPGAWYEAVPVWYSAGVAGVAGFVGVYALCYVVHEWGHYLGARVAGATVPLRDYRGALMCSFDVGAHDARQFLWLSWGGVAGYVLVAATGLAMFAAYRPDPCLAGVAIGSLAFVSQSLAVDVPQIVRVHRGADALRVNRDGASLAVIKRRTLQTWSALALAIAWWNL